MTTKPDAPAPRLARGTLQPLPRVQSVDDTDIVEESSLSYRFVVAESDIVDEVPASGVMRRQPR